MLHTMLKADAVEYFQSSHAQSIRLASEHLGTLFVDYSGSHTATGHPVGCHQTGGPSANDKPDELERGLLQGTFNDISHVGMRF